MKQFIEKLIREENAIYVADRWYYDSIFDGLLEEVTNNMSILDLSNKSSVDFKRNLMVLFCFFLKKQVPLLSNQDYSVLQYLFDRYLTINI